MLYIPWMVILGDHRIKKISSKTSTSELSRVKNCTGRLCTGPFSHVSTPLRVGTMGITQAAKTANIAKMAENA